MRDHQRHAVQVANKIQLVLPGLAILLIENDEQSMILRQRVRQLDELPRDEGPNAAYAPWHRLVWICIEARGIVLNVKRLQPM